MSSPQSPIARKATNEEIDPVLHMIRDLSRWLKTKGIHQWGDSFPREIIEAEVSRGELFVLQDGREVIASVALSKEAGELWDDIGKNAIYLHRLAIVRNRAGEKLGESMMNWAEGEAKSRGADCLRLVCDAHNPFLPDYYAGLGYLSAGSSFYEAWKMTFAKFEKRL